jgi:hypothetical protein
MKEKQLHIRADEKFLQKLENLMRINKFKSLSDTIRRIVEKEYRKENESVHVDTGCIHCNQFDGRGCRLTGIIFPDYFNVSTKPKSCPVVEAVPVDFMREYIQRDGMSIHDISVINQMYEAYKEVKSHEQSAR